ncbi:pyocin knob domain-containing protein [Paenarthrobacter sp. NPDC089989]|uniref:pyocin knob domain-containing protein n=1 Tax=unclassified Paenarthrobacter TaxID=2634190 RepID=UPI0037FFE944
MVAKGIPGLIRWTPNMAYKAGERVAAPNGDIVTAKADFTAGATYNPANWNASTQDGRLAAVESSTVQALPRWKANTAYTAGQQVLSPGGDIVTATVAFTSGATYSAANWTPSALSTNLDLRGFPQRELVTGEDINAIRDPGVYTCPSTTVAGTLINWPAGSFTGALIVGKAKAGLYTSQEVIALVSTVAPPDHYTRTTRSSGNTTWTPWGYKGWTRGPMPDGTNLDTYREFGVWTHTNPALLTGVPADVTTGLVTVENLVSAKTGTALQRLTTADGRVYTRTASVLAGWGGITWKPVGSGTTPPVTVVSNAGLANAVLLQDWTRRMGGRKKVSTATLAFRFDHGLANFNSKHRPEMEARNFKYSLALCSGQWSRPENVGVTAEMVNAWVLAGLAEIWNHSKDHGSGDNSEAAWKAAILDGLTELRTQIPAASIDGFAPPGTAGTDFGGFLDGKTLEQFYATAGGQFILEHHPVAAGYLGASSRWQDGMVRQGLGHYTIDGTVSTPFTLATAQSLIQSAEIDKRALQFMLHPSLTDNGTNTSLATFISILDYVKAEETAGRLKIVSPYEQLLCDVL